MLPSHRISTRAFLLLRGMSSAAVFAALQSRGCSEETIDEGWELLKQSNNIRIGAPRSSASTAAARRLKELRADWYPVVDATLEARFPEIHERVFANLRRGEGPELYVVMQTLHDRVAALFASSDPIEADASARLAKRGVTPALLAEIARTIDEMKTLETSSMPASEAERIRTAEENLHAFITEWSQIIRTTVKDRRLLLAMGFLRRPRGKRKTAEPQD